MKSYQVLEIIFKGKVKRLAAAFRIRETSAAKFLRDPHNSGALNPLDRLCRVIDEAVLANREESGLLIEFLRQYHRSLIRDGKRPEWNPTEVANSILQACTKVVQALALENRPPSEQLRALIEARHVLDEAVSQLEVVEDGEDRRS